MTDSWVISGNIIVEDIIVQGNIYTNLNGKPGAVWYTGTTLPDIGLGIDGDFYLDSTTGAIYEKDSGAWVFVMNITGTSGILVFTTIGDSGAATYDPGTKSLNIPTPTLGGLGGISFADLAAASPLIYDGNGGFSISEATASVNGFLSAEQFVVFDGKQNPITLTVNGDNGAATFISDTLNIPTPTLNGLGGIGAAFLSGGTGINYDSGTGVISTSITQYTDGDARNALSLTTVGNNGAATYDPMTGGFNIPTITLNGIGGIGYGNLSATAPLVYDGTGGFTIDTASASQPGALSAADWSEFNGKQAALGYTPENAANRGAANGYCPLDGGTKIPTAYLPAGLLEYLGVWDASTNTPTLANGTGTAGAVYQCSVAGTVNFGAGPLTFAVGDWVIYNGSIWEHSPGSNAVASVNGLTGVVSLTTANIPENTNLYFTASRAIGSLLNGFAAGAGVVSSADSILQAIQKVVGNIALKLTANSPITSGTHTKITYDANGLVTAGVDATTADIADSTNKRYQTDTQQTNNDATSPIQAQINSKIGLASLSATSPIFYNNSTGDISTNLTQYTDAKTLATVLTGIVFTDSNPIDNTYTVLTAFGSVQQQLNLINQVPPFGTSFQYLRGDNSWRTLNTTVVPEGSNLYFTNSRARGALSLTTTGSSGSATYNGSTGVFNIPTYTLSGLGGISASSTDTLTNKRITNRVGSTTSSATPTINTDNVDVYKLTAQAVDITSFTTNLSGTPTDTQTLEIIITGTAARAITWGTSFVASTIALPTTTVTTATLRVFFQYDSVVTAWVCVGVA